MERQQAITPRIRAAYHEAGHAVAWVLAWRLVRLPPDATPSPELPVKYVKVFKGETGRWFGFCSVRNSLYPIKQPKEIRIAEKWRDALEWEIIFSLAGGIAEAIFCGKTEGKTMATSYQMAVYFAIDHCGMGSGDTKEGEPPGDTECFLTLRNDLWEMENGSYARPAQRTFTLIRKYWPAVEAIAEELMQSERIEGDRVEQIFDQTVKCRRTKRAVGQ